MKKQLKMTMKNDANSNQNPAPKPIQWTCTPEQLAARIIAQQGQSAQEPIPAQVPLPPPPLPEPLAYNINEAAAALNVSTKTVRRLLWRGKLTSCKALRKILIPREQIANFLKATCDKPTLN
jgi:excisionase family DNA binding protein